MDKLNNNSALSHVREAGLLADSLLREMETEELAIDRYLMKAMRLARLLKDIDAQKWLKYEMSGFPEKFVFSELGTCLKYAELGGRVTADGKYWPSSLPEIEAYIFTNKNSLSNSESTMKEFPAVKNFVEANATKDVLNHQAIAIANVKNAYVKNVKLFSSLKSAIHSYATDCFIAIELGDFAQGIFEEAREEVEKFIRAKSPESAEKLLAITSRLKEGNGESCSAALTSCRRLLMDIADAVFPAQDEEWLDNKGNGRKVQKDQYKNRIIAFVEKSKMSSSSESIIISDVEHLAARLDAVYEKSCKGVHDVVNISETRLTVISTYLLIAEVARVS